MKDESTTCYDVVVVGGGSGGMAIVNKLCSHFKNFKIAILEPSEVRFRSIIYFLITLFFLKTLDALLSTRMDIGWCWYFIT